ncbi:MAG: hypothetical protein ACXW1S_10355 [Acidimicrobiia bacterium]
MSDIWVWWIYDLELGGDPSATPIERVDVTGFHVEAIDGRIGTVDAARTRVAAVTSWSTPVSGSSVRSG